MQYRVLERKQAVLITGFYQSGNLLMSLVMDEKILARLPQRHEMRLSQQGLMSLMDCQF
ncbi:MAG: hypothetical protein HC847_13645 [Hydrococcus sp. RU_2_2]|nr:hypothetical protein [Hydrococcus sp. RU_2_2]